eukprot:CAMPEP_0174927630 /NCGR_PEP_ID=MMETSP1355-20121228/19417_1 /TAXON_ID=464990 /ORGANISM="Hemiselmis tepida, Strain CCMP443" /LENGTH=66 /DNA_ID=CAMNT_0016173747 /DNA_START=322 /DNA_END=519 /DNA_ORIENTATION=+
MANTISAFGIGIDAVAQGSSLPGPTSQSARGCSVCRDQHVSEPGLLAPLLPFASDLPSFPYHVNEQ